ncbi:glycosyltransferase [Roseomonas elaeocarpi]|uniref:Glycosyltransferase n=1 Tax=Roseomonas elaeocarpi TaxID=907779 RepID=A0ABV6JQ37_9PROT
MAGAKLGGAETFFERLCAGLHAAGEDVLPVLRREPDRETRLRQAGLAPVALGFGGPLDLLTGPRLGRALQRFAPAVTVAWMNRAARFTPRGSWTLVGRLGGYYDLRHYRRCDHLVGNTRDLVRWMVAEGWPAERAHHVPNFSPDLLGVTPAALPLPPGVPVLLAMGRLHRNKGFDTLLRALPRVPGAQLILAGEGPERAALEALARELGVADRTHFLGWRTDAGALLARADVFVCSSRHEPLGNIVLEAFSARRPVVACASQGPRELIQDGENGLLVPTDAPEALAAALSRLLADHALREQLAAAGRRAFEWEHAEAPVIARWQGFLRDVAPAAAIGRAG